VTALRVRFGGQSMKEASRLDPRLRKILALAVYANVAERQRFTRRCRPYRKRRQGGNSCSDRTSLPKQFVHMLQLFTMTTARTLHSLGGESVPYVNRQRFSHCESLRTEVNRVCRHFGLADSRGDEGACDLRGQSTTRLERCGSIICCSSPHR
jgi:hypothetical protein